MMWWATNSMRRPYIASWAVLACLVLAACTTSTADEASRSSFLYTREPIAVDLRINVVLVGLNGDGAFTYKLPESRLASLLATALPTYRPSLVEEERPLNVEYTLRYDVHHQHNIGTFTKMLGEELSKLGPPDRGATLTDYAVPPSALQAWQSYFDSITVADEYSIILLNPCKRALENARTGAEGTTVEPRWQYHYNYDGAPTQAWVSEGRYTVVDLSAGPVVYGPSDVGEGAVTAASLPRLGKFHNKLRTLGQNRLYERYTVSDFAEIEAHIATTVISAIQHVFVPDIRFPAVQADKVLVPIVVLRNHVEFNPWRKGHPYSIDIDAIRREVAKLALPNQEVTIVTDLHGLHEHKHIALALAKAHKTDTVHELNVWGRYDAKEKPYIDGRALLQQMKDAQDIITSGFLQSAEERAHLSAFFSRSQPAAQASASDSQKASRPLGTRILPVYVFSLLLSPHLQNSLLDRSSLYTASAEGVIVLQTNSTEVPVPYFAQDSPVLVHPNDPTRYIIAGIATALGALNTPLQRYSPLHSRVLQSHMWANGHHPFGPYATTTGISRVFVDMVTRNAVLSRLDQALKKIHKSIADVDRFAKRYLYDPFGENITMTEFQGRTVGSTTEFTGSMADLEPGSNGPELWQSSEGERTSTFLHFQELPASTVERLYGEMNRLEGMFHRVGGLLRDYKLNEAYEVSSSLGLAAMTFAQYVRDEIQAAEAELVCCILQHTPTHSSFFGDLLQYFLVFVVAVLFMLALVVFLKKKPQTKQSLLSKRR